MLSFLKGGFILSLRKGWSLSKILCLLRWRCDFYLPLSYYGILQGKYVDLFLKLKDKPHLTLAYNQFDNAKFGLLFFSLNHFTYIFNSYISLKLSCHVFGSIIEVLLLSWEELSSSSSALWMKMRLFIHVRTHQVKLWAFLFWIPFSD